MSRQHYANAFGVHRHYLSVEASLVFREFDQSALQGLVARAQAALERAFLDGTLPLVKGKASRIWLCNSMGASVDSIRKNQALHALLEDFDRKIIAASYLPTATRETLKKLEDILTNDCPMGSSRRQLGFTELERRLGLARNSLLTEPYSTVVRAKQSELATGAALIDGDVMLAGTVYQFSKLRPAWAISFVRRLGHTFVTFASGLRAPGNQYRGLLNLLRWIATSNLLVCREALNSINTNALLTSEHWDEVLTEYQSKMIGLYKTRSRESLETRFGSLNGLLRYLGSEGLLPIPSQPMRPPRASKGLEAYRKSVAEISPAVARSDSCTQFCSTTLNQLSTKFGVKYKESDASAFIACLKSEFDRTKEEIPSDIGRAVLAVINRRLELVKAKAIQLVKEGQELLTLGRTLMAKATLPEDFPEKVASAQSRAERTALFRQYFPNPNKGGDINTSIGNLLLLVRTRYSSLLPSTTSQSHGIIGLGLLFFQKRYLELGGRRTLQSMLTPAQSSLAAVHTLYLVESGSNLAVALSLKISCMRPSETRGHTCITGHKVKAAGKPIFSDLATRGPCVQAMQWAAVECGVLRSIAPPSTRERLFVVVRGDRVEPFDASWYLTWFKTFTQSVPELSDLNLLPSMLRPSVLLKAALENDGRLLLGMAIGQNTTQVAEGYQGKFPVLQMRDASMRQFQHHFESLTLVHAARVTEPNGYTNEQVSEREHRLVPTGLGPFCKNPYGKPGHEGKRCDDLECAGRKCPQMEIVLHPLAVAQMQAWKTALEAATPSWIRDREERWTSVWLPLLCLLTVVQEKASRGPLLQDWMNGTALRMQHEQQPGYTPPCPF